jgi:hypothetical protein
MEPAVAAGSGERAGRDDGVGLGEDDRGRAGGGVVAAHSRKGVTGVGIGTSFVHTYSLLVCWMKFLIRWFITERNYMPDVRTSYFLCSSDEV